MEKCNNMNNNNNDMVLKKNVLVWLVVYLSAAYVDIMIYLILVNIKKGKIFDLIDYID